MIWLLALLVTLLALAWRQTPLARSTQLGAALLLAFTVFGEAAFAVKFLAWLTFGGLAAACNIEAFRQAWIITPIMHRLAARWPALGADCRAELAAGTVSFERDLMSGEPDWNRLLTLPTPSLSPDEQAFIAGPVAGLSAMLDDWDITHVRADLPPKVWTHLKKHRFFGLAIPPAQGGLGYSAIARSAVLTELAGGPAGAMLHGIVAAANGPVPTLLASDGSEQQQSHHLPRLAKGQALSCFVPHRPGANAASGVICHKEVDGQPVLGIRLDWDSRHIPLAPIANLIGLMVCLRDPDHLLGPETEIGLSCCLIPSDSAGVELGPRQLPPAAPLPIGPCRGRDVFVPVDSIVGGPQMAGQGYRLQTESLSAFRGIMVPAGCSGTMSRLARHAGAYAKVRQQRSGAPARQAELLEALAGLAGNCYAGHAVRALTAGSHDLGEQPLAATGISARLCWRLSQDSARNAIDIYGGDGLMQGPRNPAAGACIHAAIPLAATGTGPQGLARETIGQLWLRSHPSLLGERESLLRDDLAAFDHHLRRHCAHVLSHASRSFVHALGRSRLAAAPAGSSVADYFRRTARYSANLALISEILLLPAGGLAGSAHSIERLADMLAALYVLSATLKEFTHAGEPAAERPLLDLVCQSQFWRIESALDEILDNLQSRPLARLSRMLMLPLGRRAAPPSDTLRDTAARLLQQTGPVREALTSGYNGSNLPDRILSAAEEQAALVDELLAIDEFSLAQIAHKPARARSTRKPVAAD